MRFKRFFFATLISTAISAVVGIVMAYAGYGVWALVWQQVTNRLIIVIVFWFMEKWNPTIMAMEIFHEVGVPNEHCKYYVKEEIKAFGGRRENG
jgi:O-antigen/teichoic acid export membrane protein